MRKMRRKKEETNVERDKVTEWEEEEEWRVILTNKNMYFRT